jgi:hypothetical protein
MTAARLFQILSSEPTLRFPAYIGVIKCIKSLCVPRRFCDFLPGTMFSDPSDRKGTSFYYSNKGSRVREAGVKARFSRQGKPSALLSCLGSYRNGQKNQRRLMHTAATPIRNPDFSHAVWVFVKSYEQELLSTFQESHPFIVSFILSFRLPLL